MIENLDQIFDKVLLDIQQSPERLLHHGNVWRKAHRLAEAAYPKAKQLFIQGMYHPDWVWRQDCIRFLGFHYTLEETVIQQIGNILMSDPFSDVRVTAASVLGNQSHMPDYALLHALSKDTDDVVRNTSFIAILQLLNIPFETCRKKEKQLVNGEISPTPEEIIVALMENDLPIPSYL